MSGYLVDTDSIVDVLHGMDLLIAATAIAYDLTLVTRNLRDFQLVPTLKLYLPEPN